VAKLDKYFDVMLDGGASDMILAEGAPPKVRVAGRVQAFVDGKLSRSETERLLKEICTPERWESFLATGDLDFAYPYGERARFRANYYRHTGGLGAVFRLIPSKILSCDQLCVPAAVRDLARLRSGLVLVTGPTGSGKSTTLAALIDQINTDESRHILTIEEPIEFVHPVKRAYIVQREVGTDVMSFADALGVSSRFDCDVILVGEMRDYETVSLAISASERGLLVFGTLHTNCAAKTIDRIIDVFPADEQMTVRKTLTVVLKGVCSQLLCRTSDGKGRVGVHEVLIQTPALSTIIREGATQKITSVMQMGRALGMQLMDDAIEEQRAKGKISGHVAYMKSLDKTRFQQYAQEEASA
jgi:twitching motility protein PilT